MPFNVSVVVGGKSQTISAAAYSSEIAGIVNDLSGAVRRGLVQSIVIKDWSDETPDEPESLIAENNYFESVFEPGDKVRRKDSGYFSNGEFEVTVNRVEKSASGLSDLVWFTETGTHLSAQTIEKVLMRTDDAECDPERKSE